MPNLKEEVQNAVDAVVETPPTIVPENVSSPEVKVEVKQPEGVDKVSQLSEQVENLNRALREEREGKKGVSKKVEELEAQIASLSETSKYTDKLKSVFSPEVEEEEKPEFITKDDFEKMLQEKLEEQKKQLEHENQSKTIKEEIKSLETKWDGKEGKPQYDDQKVIEWQKQNNKLYLSPSEAFIAMYKDDIVEWEVKQRIAGVKPSVNPEVPGSSSPTHQPTETVPKTETELRKAILEAIENVDKEI